MLASIMIYSNLYPSKSLKIIKVSKPLYIHIMTKINTINTKSKLGKSIKNKNMPFDYSPE
jgi:hypothetical protein